MRSCTQTPRAAAPSGVWDRLLHPRCRASPRRPRLYDHPTPHVLRGGPLQSHAALRRECKQPARRARAEGSPAGQGTILVVVWAVSSPDSTTGVSGPGPPSSPPPAADRGLSQVGNHPEPGGEAVSGGGAALLPAGVDSEEQATQGSWRERGALGARVRRRARKEAGRESKVSSVVAPAAARRGRGAAGAGSQRPAAPAHTRRPPRLPGTRARAPAGRHPDCSRSGARRARPAASTPKATWPGEGSPVRDRACAVARARPSAGTGHAHCEGTIGYVGARGMLGERRARRTRRSARSPQAAGGEKKERNHLRVTSGKAAFCGEAVASHRAPPFS